MERDKFSVHDEDLFRVRHVKTSDISEIEETVPTLRPATGRSVVERDVSRIQSEDSGGTCDVKCEPTDTSEIAGIGGPNPAVEQTRYDGVAHVKLEPTASAVEVVTYVSVNARSQQDQMPKFSSVYIVEEPSGTAADTDSRDCPAKEEPPSDERKPRVFPCDACKVGLSTEAYLTKHVRYCKKKKMKMYSEHRAKRAASAAATAGRAAATSPSTERGGNLEVARDVGRVPCEDFPHGCDFCGAGFRTRAQLKRHVFLHTGLRPHVCEVCGSSFKEKGVLKKHALAHTRAKTYVCVECGAVRRLPPPGRVATADAPRRCVDSGRACPDPAGGASRPTRSHACAVCGSAFTTSGHLSRHRRIHSGERPHACSQCSASFTTETSLKRHELVHGGTRPHRCTECDYRCTTVAGLVVHRRVHTGERPYGCPDCGRRFATNGQLTRHGRVHTRERPFVCLDCGKSYSDNSHLAKHKATRHS